MSGKMHSSCVGRGYIFLIMILPAIVRSEEDGAIPMGPHLMATCRIILNVCQ